MDSHQLCAGSVEFWVQPHAAPMHCILEAQRAGLGLGPEQRQLGRDEAVDSGEEAPCVLQEEGDTLACPVTPTELTSRPQGADQQAGLPTPW